MRARDHSRVVGIQGFGTPYRTWLIFVGTPLSHRPVWPKTVSAQHMGYTEDVVEYGQMSSDDNLTRTGAVTYHACQLQPTRGEALYLHIGIHTATLIRRDTDEQKDVQCRCCANKLVSALCLAPPILRTPAGIPLGPEPCTVALDKLYGVKMLVLYKGLTSSHFILSLTSAHCSSSLPNK